MKESELFENLKEKEDSTATRELGSFADEETRKEQLAVKDYGYKERAIVLPQDDCFFKLENALKEEKAELLKECNVSILHSRIADLNLQYNDA